MRSIQHIVRGREIREGAGVRLTRLFSDDLAELFDPFLLLDVFDSRDPSDYIKGFPWHPHRGIETVTYLLDGIVEHGDSLGNTGAIEAGSCQWMTAGSGIIHQEMPQESERLLGMQLWVNLPRQDKMTTPVYRDLTPDRIPVTTIQGGTVRVLAGECGGVSGPVAGLAVNPVFLDVNLPAGASFQCEVNPDDTAFAYNVMGSGHWGLTEAQVSRAGDCVLLGPGESVLASASANEPWRFFLFCGRPLHEPIAWRGPIVMNTEAELDEAFAELREGTFLRDEQQSR